MEIINAPEYIRERERKYDEIAGVAYVNIFTLSKNSDVVAIKPFDPKNKEHLFVLNVAKGVGSVMQKSVAVDASKFTIWRLNRGLTEKSRYEKLTVKEGEVVNPNELLDFMRDWAKEFIGEENFNFGQIYDAFYAKQKGKKE